MAIHFPALPLSIQLRHRSLTTAILNTLLSPLTFKLKPCDLLLHALDVLEQRVPQVGHLCFVMTFTLHSSRCGCLDPIVALSRSLKVRI
jgi:hypothetical protein